MTGDIARRIAALGPRQRELLEGSLGPPPRGATPISRNSHAVAPASPTQKSMWFVHNLHRESPVLNTAGAVRIRGALDTRALSAAITGLVQRHEILRTTFHLEDGELKQSVGPVPEKVLEIEEAPGDGDELSEGLRKSITAVLERPFDLASDLMYRAVLFRLGADDHVLVRAGHHIAFDRWSVALANQDTSEMYRSALNGDEPRLLELPYQYADFATWQLGNLEADGEDARLRYFTTHVAGAPRNLDIPTDRPRTRAQGPAAVVRTRMDGSLADSVRRFAREVGATPFMVLLAAYGLLLSRIARTDQLLIGIPVALRSEPDLERVIGPFINTVVLRSDLRGDPSLRELVERARRVALNMIPHQDLPIDELVRSLAPERVTTRTPLFQAMFDYLNTPHLDLDLEGLAVEPIPLDPTSTAYDLTLYMEDLPGSFSMRWEYRSDLFDRATIGALAGAYGILVERMISAPSEVVSDVGTLDPPQEARVRTIGSGPSTTVEGTVLEMLERSLTRSPGSVAIETSDETLTYGELASLSRRLSLALHQRGVGPGQTVALVLERSSAFVVGLVGVMMSGAAPVMLDPEQPAQRLDKMIDMVDPSLVLVDDNARQVKGGDHSTIPSLIGDIGSADKASFLPLTPVSPSDPAYLVFTSGSAGHPKAVSVGHGSLANFVDAAVGLYDLSRDDRVLQFASPGFDTVVEEIFPILTALGTVVVSPVELFPSFEAFERFTEENSVTILDLPTAWWHSWVADMNEAQRRPPDCLRTVIVGGEAARTDIWGLWKPLAGPIRWINSYGPSEATVVVSTFEPPATFRPSSPLMPIGKPLQNVSFTVIDESGHTLPPRIAGELVIEGAAVALGYLDPVETLSSFDMRDPILPRYRTGDRVRLMSDGTFEFLGRIDSQVKIRGVRVELAEVEAAVRAHEGIADAVVVSDGSGLIGHVVARKPSIDGGQLRDHLSRLLPEPMIPGTWQIHDEFPTTPSGKIDRGTLRVREQEPSHRGDSIAPRSPVESQIADIWRSVLKVPAISMDDSFFDLGGHSLLGVKMLSEILSSFGVQLPLRAIFEFPTIEAMARLVEDADA